MCHLFVVQKQIRHPITEAENHSSKLCLSSGSVYQKGGAMVRLSFCPGCLPIRIMCRVGQNHIYTVYIRYFWQGNYEIYGHIRCIYTVLANPNYVARTTLSLTPCYIHHLAPCYLHHLAPCYFHHLAPCYLHLLTPCYFHHLTPCYFHHLAPCCFHHLAPCCFHPKRPV